MQENNENKNVKEENDLPENLTQEDMDDFETIKQMLENGDPSFDDIVKRLKRIDKRHKNPVKEFLKKLLWTIIQTILVFIVYVAAFGIFDKAISVLDTKSAFIYIGCLTAATEIVLLIKPLYEMLIAKFTKNPLYRMAVTDIVSIVILLGLMIGFNLYNQNYFVFKNIFYIVLYFMFSQIIITLIDYYKIKLLRR